MHKVFSKIIKKMKKKMFFSQTNIQHLVYFVHIVDK